MRDRVGMFHAARRGTWMRVMLALLMAVPPAASVISARHDALAAPRRPYTVVLAAPRLHANAAAFVWTIRHPGGAAHLSSVVLSGCWSARQVARATTTVRRARVRVDRRTGAITVDRIAQSALPLTLKVRFTASMGRKATGTRVALRPQRARSGLALSSAGPTCRPVPSLAAPAPPSTSTTFAWSVPQVPLIAGRTWTVDLAGCWGAGQIKRVTSNRRPLTVRVNQHSGAIALSGRRGRVTSLRISVTFKGRLHSAANGARVRLHAGKGGKKITAFSVGGPACRARPATRATATTTHTATATPVPSATSMPTWTATATPSPSPMPTETPAPTATPMPTETPTATATPVPTSTPTAIPSPTATATATATPTQTPTGTLTGVTSAAFTATGTGEALLALQARPRDAYWKNAGDESAVLAVSVDGQYREDVVLFNGTSADDDKDPAWSNFTYALLLGSVQPGPHTVSVSYEAAKSAAGATGADVFALTPRVVYPGDADYTALRYSPIVYGRNLFGPYENNHTDVPAVLYHVTSTDSSGDTNIWYTMIFSNEDGGTGGNANIGALMARWGRSTDIEWVYHVKLNSQGQVLQEEYQGGSHAATPFTGLMEDGHPLLYTQTGYNTFGEITDLSRTSGYRFSLDPEDVLPAGRSREAEMDSHPWTYRLSADEAWREGDIQEAPGNPTTEAVSDERNYAYIELNKSTSYSAPPASGSWVGVALAVKLKDGMAVDDPKATWYRSDHYTQPAWSIQRDGPAATTVELPPGTTWDQVQAVKAVAVPVGNPPAYTIRFTAIKRAFLLDQDYLPQPSFITWSGALQLTPANPEAIVWQAP